MGVPRVNFKGITMQERIEGLKKAIEIVENTGRFGLDKAIAEMQNEIKRLENARNIEIHIEETLKRAS